ncbi:MAG: hypothetical protein H7A20_12015 [Rhodanobacteraceae bacterium]|nr:hypothetical protein [Xanthomonadales bacterium]MCP5479485.1 hypothetical protein [Rhodanobacteraceae bacterium]HPF73841.1 hypothetical protein [Xanthomonadaceae bacterium]HRY00125.1 hypothetical protein [Xanthomonadaceae bacterium]
MQISPLRQFLLAALLWLPACFFLWAVLSSAVVWPAVRIGGWLLTVEVSQAIESIMQVGAQVEINTRLITQVDGRAAQLVLTSNPLIYAWCLPLFAGLVMATPIAASKRLKQFAIGLPILWLVASWGLFFDVVKLIMFNAGPMGQAVMQQAGWNADAVALGYQFGYLILPTVVPVALWIALNRHFLEALIGWREEPDEDDGGHSARDDANDGETLV